MNTAHYKGAVFPQQILNEKTFQAVKNQVQPYLLWSFLSAALTSNTRSRSHFCWTSFSIFFRKSTFAVPLRSCSAEKGREVWLKRVRNSRTVTHHRPPLMSLGRGKHCPRSLQQRWLRQPEIQPSEIGAKICEESINNHFPQQRTLQ